VKGQPRGEVKELGLGMADAYLSQLCVVDEVRSVPVDESTKG
jgi:hypothetical protein